MLWFKKKNNTTNQVYNQPHIANTLDTQLDTQPASQAEISRPGPVSSQLGQNNITYSKENDQLIQTMNLAHNGNCGGKPYIDKNTQSEISGASDTACMPFTSKFTYLYNGEWNDGGLIKITGTKDFAENFNTAKGLFEMLVPAGTERAIASMQGYNPDNAFLSRPLLWFCGDCNQNASSECVKIYIGATTSAETGFPGMKVELGGTFNEVDNLFGFVQSVFNNHNLEISDVIPNAAIDCFANN